MKKTPASTMSPVAFHALAAAVSLCLLTAPSARGEVLVYEGFHPADYGITTGTGTQSADKGNTTGNYTTNVVTGAWTAMGGTQITVYGADFGLALPAEMAAAGFAAQGGSIGLNPDNDSTAHRAMSHNLAANTLKASSGTLYFRMLLNLDSTAAKKLAAGDALAQKDGGYFGFGFGKSPSENDYYAPTHLQSAISFVIWKNSSNQYVLSFVHTTASGSTFTSYPIVTDITLGTTYLCYAEVKVGAGTDGKEILRAGAMAVGAYTTNVPWAALSGENDSVEVELITDANYPTCMAVAGPYGTKNSSTKGYFRADEIVVGTEIGDILYVSTTFPMLSDGSLSLSGGSYTASAALAQSAANVTYTLSDGDSATTETPVALGIGSFAAGSTATGTFAAPTDNTTYEVLLTAENAGGETVELSLGTIYGGTLALAKVSDGSESGPSPATLVVSRESGDPLPLVVNYAFTDGTAVAGVNYVDDAGSVTIPAGETSATITVRPLIDAATSESTSLVVSIAPGNYTAPAGVEVAIGNTPSNNGVWTSSSNGGWSNADNWQGGVVAGGPASTAAFVADLAGERTVTPDASPRIVGHLAVTNLNANARRWTMSSNSQTEWLKFDPDGSGGGTSVVSVAERTTLNVGFFEGTNVIRKTGAGTFRLAHPNGDHFKGGILVEEGTLQISHSDAIKGMFWVTLGGGALPATLSADNLSTVNHCGIRLFGDSTNAVAVYFGIANSIEFKNAVRIERQLVVNADHASADIRLTGKIYGYGGIYKTGSGSLRLSRYDNETGDIVVSAGRLLLQEHNGAISAGTVVLGDGRTGSGNVSVNVGYGISLDASRKFHFTANGTGQAKIGTFAGSTSASSIAGTVQIDRAVVVGNSNLTGNGLTLSGVISGAGSVTVANSAGYVTRFSGANAYTGGTAVSGGRLTVLSGGKLGTGGVEVLAGATLGLDTGSAIDDEAGVSISDGDSCGVIDLAGGVSETVKTLTINGSLRYPGTYGATGSGAKFVDDSHFAGTGVLMVSSGRQYATILVIR